MLSKYLSPVTFYIKILHNNAIKVKDHPLSITKTHTVFILTG